MDPQALMAMRDEFSKIAMAMQPKPKPALVGQALVQKLLDGARKIGTPAAMKRPIVPLLTGR